MSLPQYIMLSQSTSRPHEVAYVLRRNDGHLISSHQGQTPPPHAANPHCKFRVERARTMPGAVHISSCYNNKYWVRLHGNNSVAIVVSANERNEDSSTINCTLFMPVLGSRNTLQLRHVHSGWWVTLVGNGVMSISRRPTSGPPLIGNEFKVIDWDALTILPKNIALRGDNGLYVTTYRHRGSGSSVTELVSFTTEDIGRVGVHHEAVIWHCGCVSIRAPHGNTFWTNSGNRILGTAVPFERSAGFEPFRAGSGDNLVVALLNHRNNRFCGRHRSNELRSTELTMNTITRLTIVEPIIQRRIDNVQYRLEHARIHNEELLIVGNTIAENPLNTPITMTVSVTYTETRSQSWTRSTTHTNSSTISASLGIPYINLEGSISVTNETSVALEWGHTDETQKSVTASQEIQVPPNTTMRLVAQATKATYDIPFSYVQRDHLYNGTIDRIHKEDGCFIGANTFKVRFRPREEVYQNVGYMDGDVCVLEKDSDDISESDTQVGELLVNEQPPTPPLSAQPREQEEEDNSAQAGEAHAHHHHHLLELPPMTVNVPSSQEI